MIPYLHILVHYEKDGSLHALGAFTSKEKQDAYLAATGLQEGRVRLDFYNGPFDDDTSVIYAGHRRWNMDRFQLAGYFRSEDEAWTWVTQEGYVSVLQIDPTYETEQAQEKEALELYSKLNKQWQLSPYEDLVAREGAKKARANIMLRFYEDALKSFKPKTRRDIRELYAILLLILTLPLVAYFTLSKTSEFGENLPSVNWLPDEASHISFYRSKQVEVYEFKISLKNFKLWAEANEMTVRPIQDPETLSRYKAYHFTANEAHPENNAPTFSISLEQGLIAQSSKPNSATVLYDQQTAKAYVEHIMSL